MLAVAAGASAPASAAAVPPTTVRVSVNSAGVQGNGGSSYPVISSDQRFVAFQSNATNLVKGDTNASYDVFVRDRKLHKTVRVSVNSAGFQGNAGSYSPVISADGRFVAFASSATNLVQGDTNTFSDVFVRDRKLRKTVRVSVNSAGVQGNSNSDSPGISADGRFAVFASTATNLINVDTNASSDVFVRDRKLRKTVRASVSSAEVEGDDLSYIPAISADGRFVAFQSAATNLVQGDTNAFSDVFVRDRKLGKTVRVSVNSAGVEGDGASGVPAISADGRFVAFQSGATNLINKDTNAVRDVFLRDRKLRTTVRVSVKSAGFQGNDDSYVPALSAGGRFVAFESVATNLVKGDTNASQDVFVRDRKLHETIRVSVNSAGVQGNADSFSPTLSANGRFIAFSSVATKLVKGDTNAFEDVFVRGPNG